MCLIVAKDGKGSFSVQDFKASWGHNSDGTGIMYVENGRVVVEKTMGNLKDSLDLYYKHMHREQFVLHHRMATHGEKSLLNVHPFKVLSKDDGDPYDLYMAHNGVIPMSNFSNDCDKRLSDTHLFVVEYLTPLLREFPDIINHKVFQIMLHDFIGTNKLAFLRSDGGIWIFNKSAGEEHNGCWLSNKHSIHVPVTYYAKKHGVYNADDYTHDDYIGGDYSYEKGQWWKNDWNKANNLVNKAKDSLSTLTINEILESIDKYAGFTAVTLEELVISDPHVVYDMLNLLSPTEVKKEILDLNATVIAEQLADLLQGYAKKKAA